MEGFSTEMDLLSCTFKDAGEYLPTQPTDVLSQKCFCDMTCFFNITKDISFPNLNTVNSVYSVDYQSPNTLKTIAAVNLEGLVDADFFCLQKVAFSVYFSISSAHKYSFRLLKIVFCCFF